MPTRTMYNPIGVGLTTATVVGEENLGQVTENNDIHETLSNEYQFTTIENDRVTLNATTAAAERIRGLLDSYLPTYTTSAWQLNPYACNQKDDELCSALEKIKNLEERLERLENLVNKYCVKDILEEEK